MLLQVTAWFERNPICCTCPLRSVDDTKAVSILEEAQHGGEDRENQGSCEVLGEDCETENGVTFLHISAI